MNIQVSAIINGHREKLISYKSLRGFFKACQFAESKGIKVEKIGCLDCADDETRAQFFKFDKDFDRIVEIDAGDLAVARNEGVINSRGKYVAFLDADDFWCEDWIYKAFTQGENAKSENFVLHPQRNIYFGAGQFSVWDHYDSHAMDPDQLGILLFENLWTSLSFAPRSVFTRFPYSPSKLGSGFGYEDWHWNCETLGKDIEHLIVPETRHFVRVKGNSLMKNHHFVKATVRPNSLFNSFKKFQPRLSAFFDVPQPVAKPSKPLKKSAKKIKLNSKTKEISPLSDSDMREMKALANLDHELFPSLERVSRCGRYISQKKTGSRVYSAAMELIGRYPPVTHVIVVPWLKRGGADLAALLHAKSIVNSSSDHCVMFVGTENSPSTWLEKLPSRCFFIPLGQIASTISVEEKNAVLLRVLLQVRPQVIHVIQSHSGWTLFCTHGDALNSQSKLFTSVYLDGLTDEGERVGYARSFLLDCYKNLTAVFSDNQRYIDDLCAEFGYDKKLFSVLRHPLIEDDRNVGGKRDFESKRFLWASRLDRQKRPDVLVQIARANPHVKFDVYGEAVLNTDSYIDGILKSKPKNIILKGKYDSFFEIAAKDDYCGFVYTSESDGLPNVLLEVGACNLPVIAPDVGGISELIDEETGFLISKCDAVREYTSAISEIIKSPALAMKRSMSLKDRVKREHSWDRFSDSLSQSGYFGK